MGYRVTSELILSDILEVHAVDHCNMACRGCSHLSPIAAKWAVDPVKLAQDLILLRSAYRTRRVRLLGGEPLLHPKLAEVIAAVRASEIAERISIVTNGVLLPDLADEIWEALDMIEVSVYPGRDHSESAWRIINERARAHQTELEIRHWPRFREAYSEQQAVDESLVQRIYQSCQVAHLWACHNVYGGFFFKCPQAHSFERRSLPVARERNGVSLRSERLLEELSTYLTDQRPLEACRSCLGSVGVAFEHQELRRPDWQRPQERPLEEMVDWAYLEELERSGLDEFDGRWL